MTHNEIIDTIGKREIKFRAWDRKHKEMWYEGGHINLSLSLDYGLFCPDPYYNGCEKDFTLMQYTGLHDKNGKEIYEGDILRNKRGIIGVVLYSRGHGGFIIKWNDGAGDRLTFPHCLEEEIIGNVFENPNLLSPDHDQK